VFFGFAATDVPKNTEHGKIFLQIEKGEKYQRTVSFSDNHMVKIILPTPEEMGVGTFDDKVLLFTRVGSDSVKGTFLFSALTTKLQGSDRVVGWLF
jgi:hypothetical protein